MFGNRVGSVAAVVKIAFSAERCKKIIFSVDEMEFGSPKMSRAPKRFVRGKNNAAVFPIFQICACINVKMRLVRAIFDGAV